MKILKLIVLFCCFNGFSTSANDYCEICVNHTLCKYKAQGPGPYCTYYDSSAKLSNQDIKELVNKINERRNFVAMGYSKILPHAANMKIIHWSNKLASIAQRWADQCDQAMQPDREDQCRDLENLKVGQNIGSVMGPSPGLSVKGYVEMWFMQVLHYTGSVTFYNKSQDYKANYLTQLLWANTEFVGCGKVKFYVDERNIMLERLVCNFAPKGNTHGKPVYSIGYPRTQCETEMVPDDQYRGLCGYEEDAIHAKLTTGGRTVNSLLRILNLSNDSVKHEIDPIRNNLNQSKINNNSSSNQQRNQKTRHIFPNKIYATVKRIPQLRKQIIGNSFINISGNKNDYHHQHDRGHSHLYHGLEPQRHNYDTTIMINTNQDFRRYDYTTEPTNSHSDTNFRRFYQYPQCTRRIRPIQENCVLNQCTTAAPDCCLQMTMCPYTCTEILCTQPVEDHTCFTPYIPPLPDPCACTQPVICPPISTNCKYSTNCPCNELCSTNTCCLTTICPGPRRQNNDFNDYRRTGMLQYYDMIPYAVVRSGNQKIPQENSSQKRTSFYPDNNKSYKAKHGEKNSDHNNDAPDYPKYKSQRNYMYRSSNSGVRKKRQRENQMPVKPFWQIENLNRQQPPQLKSLRFTTLPTRKARKNINSMKWLTTTEPITLRLADYADYQPVHNAEKYLSFNELMNLRKISDGFAHYDLRRKKSEKTNLKVQNKTKPAEAKPKPKEKIPLKPAAEKPKPKEKITLKPTTEKPKPKEKITLKPTTEKPKPKEKIPEKPATEKPKPMEKITVKPAAEKPTPKAVTTAVKEIKEDKTNKITKISGTVQDGSATLFARVNHCTRKLTCTWTAYTSHGENGENEGNRGPLVDMGGPRTPPGYVDGCTRTSTCTRDFMDRNKVPALPDSDQYSSESLLQDEDYCERRALNVQRRNCVTKKPIILQLRNIEHVNVPIFPTEVNIGPDFESFNAGRLSENDANTHDCLCKKKLEKQRKEENKSSRVIEGN